MNMKKVNQYLKDWDGNDTMFVNPEYTQQQANKVFNIMWNRPLNEWKNRVVHVKDVDWNIVWKMLHESSDNERVFDHEEDRQMEFKLDEQDNLSSDMDRFFSSHYDLI